MGEPVETPSGRTFERSAIERWLADGNVVCPLTMTALDVSLLRVNIALRRSINDWRERDAIITISFLRVKLGSSNEQEVLDVLWQLQELCAEVQCGPMCNLSSRSPVYSYRAYLNTQCSYCFHPSRCEASSQDCS